MSMLPPVFTALQASSAVTSIVGTKVYRHGRAPEGTAPPYVTWFLVSAVPEQTLSDAPDLDRCPIQVDCYHQTDAGIEALATAVRLALEAQAVVTSVPINSYDALGTKLYRIALSADWLLPRA